jgi:hypothetical protein
MIAREVPGVKMLRFHTNFRDLKKRIGIFPTGGAAVGADLSCPPPIYRPLHGYPLILLNTYRGYDAPW